MTQQVEKGLKEANNQQLLGDTAKPELSYIKINSEFPKEKKYLELISST